MKTLDQLESEWGNSTCGRSLSKFIYDYFNRTYDKMSKEEQDENVDFELKETAHWLGGWDELKERIKVLEDNANEAAFERSQNDY